MKHRVLISTLLVAGLVGCGKGPVPKNASESEEPGVPGYSATAEPTPSEPAATEPAASEPTSSEPTPSEPKATKPETGGAKAKTSGGTSAPEAVGAGSEDCKKIKKKSACKVTRGCAWRDGPGAGCTDNPIDEP